MNWYWPQIISALASLPQTALIIAAHLKPTLLVAKLMLEDRSGRSVLTSRILSHMCPLITVIMVILLRHQRQVILFDPMWPFSNACHWPYSYVYITGSEESSWIFMRHCNWMLGMKWNTALPEGLFALRHKSKSTYCPLHTNRNTTGLDLQATSMLQVCSGLEILVHLGLRARWFFLLSGKLTQHFCFSFLLCSHILICFQFCVWFWLNSKWVRV